MVHTRNNDLKNFPTGIGSYSKCLLHDSNGIVDPTSFAQFLNACAVDPNNPTTPYSGSGIADFDNSAIQVGGKLNGPLGAFGGYLGGAAPDTFGDAVVKTPVDFDSREYWVELVELYWASLLRDVPFEQYPTNATAIAAANELDSFGAAYKGPRNGVTGKVTPKELFRGGASDGTTSLFAGQLTGPYLSQLCLRPTNLGALGIDQKIRTLAPGMDFMTTFDEWKRIQRGNAPSYPLMFDDTRRFMRTGRDTAAYTHTDELYQAYLIAYLVCNTFGIKPNANNPYNVLKKQKPFATFGGPDISAVIGAVARAAIIAVWYQKWRIHLRHRPEYGGGIVYLWNQNKLPSAIRSKITNIGIVTDSHALNLSRIAFGSDLLSQAFPEGSPTHPAYPTGHGTVAGACITVLKFFFDGDDIIQNPLTPSCDGLTLKPYIGDPLTLNGELHKLGHNVSFGHGIHAGIHWRTDTDASLLLGEAVAMSYLSQLVTTYKEIFDPIKITMMNGEMVHFP